MSSPPSTPAEHQEEPAGGRSKRTFFARNRRDGARLLSSALVITVIALVNIGHPVGRVVALLGGALSLYWWLQYRQLTS